MLCSLQPITLMAVPEHHDGLGDSSIHLAHHLPRVFPHHWLGAG